MATAVFRPLTAKVAMQPSWIDGRKTCERGGDLHQAQRPADLLRPAGNLQSRLLVSCSRLPLRRLSGTAAVLGERKFMKVDHRLSGEVSVGFVYAAQSREPSRDNSSARNRAGSRRARNWLSTWCASNGRRSLLLTTRHGPPSRPTTFSTRRPISCGSVLQPYLSFLELKYDGGRVLDRGQKERQPPCLRSEASNTFEAMPHASHARSDPPCRNAHAFISPFIGTTTCSTTSVSTRRRS